MMLKTSWNIQFFFLLACNVKNQYPEHQDSRSPTQMKNKKSRQNGEKKKEKKINQRKQRNVFTENRRQMSYASFLELYYLSR